MKADAPLNNQVNNVISAAEEELKALTGEI